MQSQGSQILNTSYFTALTKRAKSINTCSELQDLVSDALASIKAQEEAIQAQLATVTPMLALLNIPTSPNAVVGWVGNYINTMLVPQLKPAISYALQVPELALQVAELTSALKAAAASIPSCSVDIPGL